jgi:AcrR family transcriptional regulator
MTDEIKTVARRHLATDGANLSLRAVARDLGMVSSAVYRYFASRDELLTALILDAYNALGTAAEQREASVSRKDLAGRWLAVCHGVRDWALAQPHEYALIYGTPVPGYRAPQDTVMSATRVVRLLGSILADGVANGALEAPSGDRLPRAIRPDLTRIAAVACPDVPLTLLNRGLTAWLHMFGTVSFELFGQFNNAIEERAQFYDHQMRAMSTYIGLQR